MTREERKAAAEARNMERRKRLERDRPKSAKDAEEKKP